MSLTDIVPLAVLFSIIPIGFLIGSVGIGGVLLAPCLVQFAGLGVRDAIAVSMASFIIPGALALFLLVRSTGRWLPDRWAVLLGTVPGAFFGAFALSVIPERVALAGLAIFMLATSARVLLTQAGGKRDEGAALTSRDGLIGLTTGAASALTGTGGPMAMVPVLLWGGTPVLEAVVLGQTAQLPVATTATLGNVLNGPVDIPLASLLGILLVPGILLGRASAGRVPLKLLTRTVALLLVCVGLWLALRASRGL